MSRAGASLPFLLACLALVVPGATGCIHKGYFSDGTSLSLGKSTRGVLVRGRELPHEGPGFVVPPLWVGRQTQYGVDELVAAVQRAAARVAERIPGGTLGVGDLSSRGGGRTSHHRSHENGRDADLIFFAIDEEGHPLPPPPDAMPRYRRNLTSRAPRETPAQPISPRRFDLARNWALVAALLEDSSIDVEYLFVSEPLREKLLTQAFMAGEREELIAKARFKLRTPGHGALPHDDHLHLRIKCPIGDRELGCVDGGKVRLRVERVPGPRVS